MVNYIILNEDKSEDKNRIDSGVNYRKKIKSNS